MTRHGIVTDEKESGFCNGEIGYHGIVEHINDGVVIIKDGKIIPDDAWSLSLSLMGNCPSIAQDYLRLPSICL